jgi:hypothetical protein
MKPLLCLLSLLVLVTAGVAQTAQPSPSPSPLSTPGQAARPGDVDTVDHIINAVYDSISGPAGPRDWNRFRSLFYRGARLIPSRADASGKASAATLSTDDYAQRGADYFAKEGFFENPVANRVEIWDHIAHVWSTYESRHAKGDAPFARGINSFQLLNDGSRWWILTIYWEGEDPAHPLPEKYLK